MATTTTASEPRQPARLLSDEALLLWYRNLGDEEAFRELIARHENELFHYLCRYLHDASLAEEVVQASFMRLHQHRHDFQPDRRVRPWLYTIATHLAIDALRRAARHPTTSLDAEHGDEATLKDLLVGPSEDPAARMEQEERGQWLHKAVDELPQHLREALNLVYFGGLNYADAARRLGIPLGTLKSRLHESLVKLNGASKRSSLP